MSYRGLLKQRADIYRPTFGTAIGPEPSAVWSDTPNYTGVRCRIQALQTKEQDKETGVVVSTHNSFWEYGVDLLEQDRVVVGDVRYDVQGVDVDVSGEGHHVEAALKVVR